MKNIWKQIVSILLCIMIVMSTFFALFSYFVKSTILSEDFYLGIVATPDYISLVKKAIDTEFEAQSSYVGIPEDVFASMLDDAALHLMLRQHIASATAYMNGLAAFEKPEYPQNLLTAPLDAYIEQETAKSGTVPTQEQYDQMTAVAADSAKIIQNQICLLDLDLVKDRAVFRTFHNGILALRDGFVPSVLLALASCAMLVLLYRKSWRAWLNRILVSFWITGSLLLVPTLVLQFTGLTRRLAIETGYLKYFVDTMLTDMNLYFLAWGAVLFAVTSVVLCVLTWTHHTGRSKGSGHILQQGNPEIRSVTIR